MHFIAKDNNTAASSSNAHKVNVEGIVLAGPGELKNKLEKEDWLDPRISKKVVRVVDTGYSGKNGLNQAVSMCTDLMEGMQISKNLKTLEGFFDLLSEHSESSDGDRVCIGPDEIMLGLDASFLKKIIVWDQLPVFRCTLNCCKGGQSKVVLVKKEMNKISNISSMTLKSAGKCELCSAMNLLKNKEGKGKEKITEGEETNCWEIEECVPFLKWLADNYELFGIEVEVVTDQTDLGMQFCKGLGGLAGITRYPVDLSLLRNQLSGNDLTDQQDEEKEIDY